MPAVAEARELVALPPGQLTWSREVRKLRRAWRNFVSEARAGWWLAATIVEWRTGRSATARSTATVHSS